MWTTLNTDVKGDTDMDRDDLTTLQPDLFWLRDASLEDAGSLPSPDELAASIMEDLQTALEQFSTIAEDLAGKES